tara:strand:- start:2081 stop:2482 length:402 start_codon:yes stop_codon:yes gene_type:complete
MKTFFMVKPDGVERQLTGKIINILESEGYQINKLKKMIIDEEKAKLHYEEHREKPFFSDLIQFITSGPVVVMELEGNDVITKIRELMGATNPSEAEPGTIRAQFGTEIEKNVVHGSDSIESAERELEIFFGKY